MKNGRENRNNGNQEKGKEEKEALSKHEESSVQGNGGRSRASPKFFLGRFSEAVFLKPMNVGVRNGAGC
jgi:hypothetical protein